MLVKEEVLRGEGVVAVDGMATILENVNFCTFALLHFGRWRLAAAAGNLAVERLAKPSALMLYNSQVELILYPPFYSIH